MLTHPKFTNKNRKPEITYTRLMSVTIDKLHNLPKKTKNCFVKQKKTSKVL